MPYAIEFSRGASDDIDVLYRSDRKLFHRIINKIGSLEESPHEGKPLVGNHGGEFSLRVGTYRIVYEVDTSKFVIYILTVKYKKHAYR